MIEKKCNNFSDVKKLEYFSIKIFRELGHFEFQVTHVCETTEITRNLQKVSVSEILSF